ncbi:MAG TPA: GntR family transcriptional regulator [Roseomonas sp.]|nr:GntR family transcriptional regulator [Roseomonas sp.]
MDSYASLETLPPVLPLDRTRQAAPQVFEQLREQILAIRLVPGAVLSRLALQRAFGLSQTPIRDALSRLAEEGLVDVFPQHATRVSRIHLGLARQAHFLRVAIELEVVRVVAEAPPPATLERLQAMLGEQERLLAAADYGALTAGDASFHRELYLTAGMPDLWEMVRQKSGHIDRLRRLNLPDPGKAEAVVHDHGRLLAALRQGDPGAAQAALRAHLSGTLRSVDQIRARHPGYVAE